MLEFSATAYILALWSNVQLKPNHLNPLAYRLDFQTLQPAMIQISLHQLHIDSALPPPAPSSKPSTFFIATARSSRTYLNYVYPSNE